MKITQVICAILILADLGLIMSYVLAPAPLGDKLMPISIFIIAGFGFLALMIGEIDVPENKNISSEFKQKTEEEK